MNTKKYFYGLLAVVFALSFSATMAVADNNGGDTVDAEVTFSKFCKGKVKGTAGINENGTVASCWKCNKNSSQTKSLGGNNYEVDFKFSDIRASKGYCRTVQPDTLTTGSTLAYCGTADRSGDLSSIFVNCNKKTPFFIYLQK